METLTRMGMGSTGVLRPPRADDGKPKHGRNRRHEGRATSLKIVRMAVLANQDCERRLAKRCINVDLASLMYAGQGHSEERMGLQALVRPVQ